MRGAESQGAGAQPGPGGGYPVDQPAQPDPQDATRAMLIGQLVSSTRRLSTMFPAAGPELRQILNLVEKVQGKIVNSKPAPETSAPPV